MLLRPLLALFSCLATAGALAQPVKCVDEKGKVSYIDKSMMAQEKCEPVRAEINTLQMQPGAMNLKPPPSAAAPAVDRAKLQAAVDTAEKKLTDAKQKLAEQESIRMGDERNYARVQERLAPFQQAVQQAEQELEQARKNAR